MPEVSMESKWNSCRVFPFLSPNQWSVAVNAMNNGVQITSLCSLLPLLYPPSICRLTFLFYCFPSPLWLFMLHNKSTVPSSESAVVLSTPYMSSCLLIYFLFLSVVFAFILSLSYKYWEKQTTK